MEIMDPTIQHLLAELSQYGYVALFPLVFVEGPIAAIVGGMLAATGAMSIIGVFFVILVANVLSDIVYYILGRYGGRTFVKHFGKYLGVTEARIDALEKHAEEHGGKTIIMAKIQVVGPLPTGIALLIALGAGKMPFWPFFWYNVIGTIPQTILLEGIGYAAGGWLISAGSGPVTITLTVLSLLALGAGVWWWIRRKKKARL